MDAGSVQDYGLQISFSATSLEFYSEADPYTDSTYNTALGSNAPYISYEFNNGNVYRNMYLDDGKAGASITDAVILEGVEAFEVVVWKDYAGGTRANSGDVDSKPTCVTVSVTLTSPNPNMATELKEREKRTITKTMYIDR